MMCRQNLQRSVSVCALTLALGAAAALAQEALPAIDVGAAEAPQAAPEAGPPAPPKEKPIRRAIPENIPAVVESVTREQIDKTVNVMTTAETIKYLPSILVRERFIGDRNAIVSTRTTGTIASAQSLVYADNILLSNLLGNSFAFAPRWGMVSPAEIDRIDIIYGPFSALYPGNSMGGVITITTRLPEHFEIHASGNAALQPFSLYGHRETDLSGDMNILVGDKINDLSYWISYDRLDAQGQAQTFPGGNVTTGAGTPFYSKGFLDLDQSGNPRLVGGSAGQDHSEQHMAKAKLDYELAPRVHATYQLGAWAMVDNTFVDTFLHDKKGVPIYNTQNGRVQIGSWSFPLVLNPSHGNATHLMQAFSVKSDTKGVFDFDLSATSYNFLRDYNNTAQRYGLLPNTGSTAYTINPRGSNVNQGGAFWRTMDARGIWRPEMDLLGKHEVSFGGHADVYSLSSVQTNTNLFTDNYYHSIQAINYGKTETKGVYAQDVWWLHPQWKLTAGARGEFWRASGGVNNTLGARPNFFPDSYKQAFSPKGALEYQVTKDFMLRGSIGRAYRFPTVNELFQNIQGPNSITINNPNLQPEVVTSYDLTGEYTLTNVFSAIGYVKPRVSLFMEDRWNAIVSQTANTTGINVTQNSNVGKARFRGVEAAVSMKDIFWHGLDFDGSVTFTDAKTLSDYQNPWFQGMQYPRVPRIRIRAVGSYSPNDDLSVAIGVRYASAAFTSLANTDFNHNNYGNVDSEYLVFDAKVNYKLTKEWTLNVGIDNIGRWKYYVNPNPYPQRTFFLGLKYDFGGPASSPFAEKTSFGDASSRGQQHSGLSVGR